MKQYFVYVLKCRDGTFYTGITINLNNRVAAHNGQNKRGAKYTRTRRPVKLAYSEIFKTKSEALKREIEIKKLSRSEKKELIDLFSDPAANKSR